MRAVPAWTLPLLLFFITGCDKQRVYEGKKDFSEGYWIFNNPAEFEFEIKDTDRSYDLLFNIRNSAKYQYQNIYLQYYLEDSTGRLLSKELKNIQLFNPITGIPLGKGIGDLFDVERKFLEHYTFGNPGKYQLRIDQFMRQDSLPEILAVGLRVEYSESGFVNRGKPD
ncbi:MAG: gliding motility lipoprotein GldH [Cytophagales bacterium]|nr:gliding motility lipoprotein GldH [Cytophagales bacterium]